MTIGFAILGCGRIGRMHADIVAANPHAKVVWTYDVHTASAESVAHKHGAKAASTVDEALGDPEVRAVLIASSTDTHVDLLTRAVKAGKAVLCEKPIDLDIARVDACWAEIGPLRPVIQLGFNRRFDPSFRAVRQGIKAGEIGKVELVVITSRDPGPPPAAYIQVSGGLFRDMMIHDFDLARFLLGEEITHVSAMASNLVDPEIGRLGDIDTAMVTLKARSGALVHINNSRRAVYGYDQRIEAFGEKGMLRCDNKRATTILRYGSETTAARDPLLNFFIERYADAYRLEIDAFIDCVLNGSIPSVGFADGRQALVLANAAYESLRTGRTVEVA